MNRVMSKAVIKLLVLTLATSASISCNKKTGGSDSAAPDAKQGSAFTQADTDELLAPIALYPDPLLAQILPAATFIDQLEEAQKTLNGKSDDNLIANQNWDISVKSVAHYPDVLQTMTEKEDWTVALGQAYANQPAEVEKSIQNLRGQAQDAGNLVTSDKMVVETKTENGQEVIVVEPAQPEVIYVPEYNPEVVYVEQEDKGPSAGTAALAFGVGLAMGAWLNRGWNWYGGGPYYHGWNGGGWIGRSASYANVNVNRNVYVNNSYRNVNVNRNINSRNINNYRTDLSRQSDIRRQNTVGRGNSLNNRGGVGNANDPVRRDNNLNDNRRDVNNRNTAAQQPANRTGANRAGASAGTSDVRRNQAQGSQNRQASQGNTSRGSASGSRQSAGTQPSGGSRSGGSKGGAAKGSSGGGRKR